MVSLEHLTYRTMHVPQPLFLHVPNHVNFSSLLHNVYSPNTFPLIPSMPLRSLKVDQLLSHDVLACDFYTIFEFLRCSYHQ